MLALSSAEAELYALVTGASQVLGLISLARDVGRHVHGKLHSDAAAALGIVNRTGLGKLRHINVQFLCVQSKTKIDGLQIQTYSDLLTKHLPAADVEKFCEYLALTRT